MEGITYLKGELKFKGIKPDEYVKLLKILDLKLGFKSPISVYRAREETFELDFQRGQQRVLTDLENTLKKLKNAYGLSYLDLTTYTPSNREVGGYTFDPDKGVIHAYQSKTNYTFTHDIN